ncbi:N-acetylglucosamine-specific PTS transporter subunit IIBC [Xenorhabdus sp. TS4]|uniref:N-acetylglucosamine-specific PTS transporter subunit IIBC n=1 Tax=Xenorhabdus sp. TS4 TaxID=1873483 RepID=UPI0016572B52|nr:N-acetylglucosamine-specific PTS transporter subunit IIBC [Xenorhabdus sp. TS4]MBC8947898.1 bifunctional maltose and glucose-specific PTS system components IICB [Xenorhabdus sp. TS4]MBC8948700.1 bifunctional maltose and glucose-specific PTS system components IICB [Xenorhabdus sp. TS4]
MSIFSYLQRLGKALMLPIASLPVAALLLRLGQPDVFNIAFIASAGGGIFENLPLLFALGISVGLAKDNSGAAALAGVVGFFILTKATTVIDPKINMSFFAGIISGIVAGHCYNRFSETQLPEFLAFFAGKRLVPIITGIICLFLAWICGHIWPYVQHGIDHFSLLVSKSGMAGWFAYGVLNRALIPFGLHYILHSVFWFSLGDCIKITYDLAGAMHNICLAPDVAHSLTIGAAIPGIEGSNITQVASDLTRGDLNRFFAGDPNAGVYMAWAYPIFMGGLPGAALAMYLAAPKSRRPQIGGMLFSVALTSFLTGITEPIEFSFLFLAPILYVLHAILAGVSMVIANSLGVLHGFGFSAGLIDFGLNWGLATKPWILIPLIILFFVIYFVVFTLMIRIFNLNTIGREQENSDKATSASQDKEAISHYISALGGPDNIRTVDACITRLRLTVEDNTQLDEAQLKKLGAKGVLKIGKQSIQVVLGPQAESIAEQVKVQLKLSHSNKTE